MLQTSSIPVVLVHWNQPGPCATTIETFLRSSVRVDVTVVDNGSNPSALVELRETVARINARLQDDPSTSSGAPGAPLSDGRPRVKLIEAGRNLGFGPGANVGLADFLGNDNAGEWVVLAPHDAHPDPDCLELMLAAAREHPMAGLMCADVGDAMVPVIDPYFGGMIVPMVGEQPTESRWESVDYPHGTLMMLSRRCLQEIGLFDERYFSYCEEAQLAARATRAGFEIGLIRSARVTNTHIGSGEGIVDYLQTRNTLLFVLEHSGRYHAFIRLCIAIIQLTRGLIAPHSRPLIFAPRARALGIRDFLRRRFGPPPLDVVSHRGR